MTENKVQLDKVLLFASLDGGKGCIPLDRDYTYGSRSSILGGKGEHTVDEETKSVSCGTCLLIPAKGFRMEVLVTPWRGVERGPDWKFDVDAVIDRFWVKFDKIKRYEMFAPEAKSSMGTSAGLRAFGHFWSSNRSEAGVTNITYMADPATYDRVMEERHTAEEKAEAAAKKEREEKEAIARKAWEVHSMEKEMQAAEEQMVKNNEAIAKLMKETSALEMALPSLKRKLEAALADQPDAKKAKNA